MSDPDDSQREGLGDLFDNLPTASSPLPDSAPRDEPAPGSRRAMREARAAAGDGRAQPDADVDADAPETVAPAPAEPVQAVPAQPADADGGEHDPHSLDALFAAEKHHDAPKKKRGRGCLTAVIVVLVIIGGIAAGGAWVYNTYQDKINELMGWGEPKDYEAGQATGEALVTIKSGDTGSPVSTALS